MQGFRLDAGGAEMKDSIFTTQLFYVPELATYAW